VLVGRGVRAERAGTADAIQLTAAAETTPQQPPPAQTPTPTGSDPTAAAPPPAVDDLSYFNRLEKPDQQVEELKPAAQKPAAPQAEKPVPAPAREQAPVAAAPPAEPPGSGYAVQIAALNVRSEADAIASRLASKGYAAYVVSPSNGTPQVYRVRIGKFGTRREAETVAAKLQKEEQFKPWVTR
jgi:septal ring-binding cell division protein DamX